MAQSIDGDFLWNDFYKNFTEGSYYEFRYKDKYLNVGLWVKGTLKKTKKWIFIVHNHDNKGPKIYAEYKNADSLLENARIDGKKLKEIWNDLILE